ncbi:ERAD-associated E3 ubiquitin-protein ligase component HRD3A-like isoform X1 [Juglans microcarpa x Juglans regia]|uniref:ERAD-associated E3 ubiquitin-protein ligase component HRD3A-like isoform X1 n=1 Tax=Juglans microcarpa x Juglans regia TaxID=2249226 RepID=UPI001B7E5F9E|nr:ERAD-associated E3 ubiquitin-protein ligase component HRD3A-like isoform X1 [Juglans microcarpa x Juglans regia]
MMRSAILKLLVPLIVLSLFPLSFTIQPYIIVLTGEDFKQSFSSDDFPDWDEFGDSGSTHKSEDELDPGSWQPLFEPASPSHATGSSNTSTALEALYFSGVSKMVSAASSGDARLMEEAAAEIENAASEGHAHARSVLGFLHGMGLMKQRNKAKSFMYHHFAAEGGNMQSKMALANSYAHQERYERAVEIYAKLADVAVKSFLVSKYPPVNEPVRIHIGAEENEKVLMSFRGEDAEKVQILKLLAQKGNAEAMYTIGMFYYLGLRGLRPDHAKAVSWFLKAVEKREPRSMEVLGEIYARGVGVERNYTKALELLTLASRKQIHSAYNGIGYLYVKGYGVDSKNYTKARECFKKAANKNDSSAQYNLGVMYLKGIGVEKNLWTAYEYFKQAANAAEPKAFYQLAKMLQTGVGLKKNLQEATRLYKVVAELGPWTSLSRWALQSYLKGDVGKAFLLYARMAELGYEVAQSNAAWILYKYGKRSMCMGESKICTDAERHRLENSLWWQAFEQGNEHAAMLIGDAYYYGRGIERDYHRAATAYMLAKEKFNAQAMFNLGYMYERGQGLPIDLHLAKRYYDQAIERDPNAKFPVTLALASLWIRMNYGNSFLVHLIDSLPGVYPKIKAWVENVLLEKENATILTLFACLLAVLYLRERHRRRAVSATAQVAVRRS